MKVYIEDSESNEIIINNTPCRKLGELKNGEEKTFYITGKSSKIFVIADALSKSFCNEYYQLPSGNDDITLSGKNKFDPSTGNAFRFDNNDSPEIAVSHKKSKKRGTVILALALAIGIALGAFISIFLVLKKAPKVFSCNELSITLTAAFEDSYYDYDASDYIGYDFICETEDVLVTGAREPFSFFEGMDVVTLEEYGDFILSINELRNLELKEDGDHIYFEYDRSFEESGRDVHYYVCLYKADEAFWLVQFMTSTKDFAKYSSNIVEWANTVTFS
jgi:hypothetical protein